jgi:hypothetical protein
MKGNNQQPTTKIQQRIPMRLSGLEPLIIDENTNLMDLWAVKQMSR